MEMEYSHLALIPIIAGIGETIKSAGVPSRYIPFINMVTGLGLCVLLCSSDSCILIGLYTGLSASGLVKSTKEFNNCLNARGLRNKNKSAKKKSTKDINNESDDNVNHDEHED